MIRIQSGQGSPGAFLLALGLFRLGFLANILSHPLIAGFITASGHTLARLLAGLLGNFRQTNWVTLAIGAAATGLLSRGCRG